MVFVQKLAEPAQRQLEKTLVRCLHLLTLTSHTVAGFTKKGDSQAIHQSISLSFLLLLRQGLVYKGM